MEGIRGSDPRSDVAFDDVSIHYESCSGELLIIIGTHALSNPWMSDKKTFTLYDQCHSFASSGRVFDWCYKWSFSSFLSWWRSCPTPRYITSIDTFCYGKIFQNNMLQFQTHVDIYKCSQCSVCNLDCAFEQDLCGFTQLMTDVFDWTRHSGSTPTAMTGPSADHTKGGRCS